MAVKTGDIFEFYSTSIEDAAMMIKKVLELERRRNSKQNDCGLYYLGKKVLELNSERRPHHRLNHNLICHSPSAGSIRPGDLCTVQQYRELEE
jgi:hypothetical protein